MSKYGVKYQIQFKNQERNTSSGFVGQTVDIGIFDRSYLITNAATTNIIDVTPGGDPLHISSVDNSEDKLTPIRATQARIQFLSDPQINLDTFTDPSSIGDIDPGDPRWYVEVKIGSLFIFKGFLNLDDCSESFMPDPNVVTLIANDGLGVLKNIPLVAQNFKTFNRSASVDDPGHWGSNTSVLNGASTITLSRTDLNGNSIGWVNNLSTGQQIRFVLSSDSTITAIYTISSILLVSTNYITFNVTLNEGTSDSISALSNWFISLVGDPFAPSGYNRIADYIAWCLLQTNLTLDLKAVFNIRDITSRSFQASSQFNSGTNIIGMPFGVSANFYTGQVITISGTASNNGTFHVIGVAANLFLGTFVSVSEALVTESVLATYQDNKFHFFDKMYQHARTYEGETVGTFLSCYDVLKEILFPGTFLTQRAGVWWIYRIDETEDNLQYSIAKFLPDGTYDSFITDSADFGQVIQKDTGRIVFSGESTEYLQSSQNKFIELDYKFEYPKETPCNSNFERGDFISTLPDENDENGNPCTVKKYALDCWTMKRGFPLHSPIVNDSLDFIKRLFNSNDYEVNRYVVITKPTAADVNTPYIESEAIPVTIKDKIDVSVDFKFPTSITSGSGYYNIMNIVLQGDDGSWWIYGREEPGNTAEAKWYDTSGFTVETNKGEQGFDWSLTESGTDWQSQSFSCNQAPVSGNVYIWLHGMNSASGGAGSYDDIDIHYTNLQVTYIPFINGSYQKYTQLSSKVSRSINFWANRTEQVYLSDGIKKLFKGALFINQNGFFALANLFFNWKNNRVPTDDQIHTFLHIQSFDVWNQYRNVMKVFRASCQGLNSDTTGGDGEIASPSAIHTYYLNDSHPSTDNKRFMLLTFDHDWYLCEWKGTLAEMYDTTKGKVYTDTLEVKYQ